MTDKRTIKKSHELRAAIEHFNFFDGLGGMAIVAAWWGIWHIIAGLTVALVWSRRPLSAVREGLEGA